MGELGTRLSRHKQVQMAVLLAWPVAVVVGLATAERIAPVVLRVMALGDHHPITGAGAHQRSVAHIDIQPMAQAAAASLVALAQEHQGLAPQPAGLAASQPPDFCSCLPPQPPRGPQIPAQAGRARAAAERAATPRPARRRDERDGMDGSKMNNTDTYPRAGPLDCQSTNK